MYTKGHAIKAAGWNDKAGMDLQTDRGPSRQMKRETQDKFRSKVVLNVSFGHYTSRTDILQMHMGIMHYLHTSYFITLSHTSSYTITLYFKENFQLFPRTI